MLQYDQTFFNRLYGAEQVFASAIQSRQSLDELEYSDRIRHWRKLFEEPAGLDRRIVMAYSDHDGMVDLRVYADNTVISARPVIGPEAWGLLPATPPVPAPGIGRTINEAFRPGTPLEVAVAAMPPGTCNLWGDEDRGDDHVHYYVLRPPALLTVTSRDGRVTGTRILDHRSGAELMHERLEANGLVPIRLSRYEDYKFFTG